jgi:xanthine dehydrogenase accessory factor
MVSREVLESIRRLIDGERLGAVATVVAGPDVGAKAVLDTEAGWIAGSLPAEVAGDVAADAGELMGFEQNRTLQYGEREVFIETVAPPPHLLIFGAVHIAQPLTTFAVHLGFRVTVCDARPAFITPERFPDADEVVVGWPGEVLDRLTIDRRTFVVLLVHDARYEDPVFRVLHHQPVRYIGAMGSRRTHRLRRERLAGQGWTDEELDRIHGPVGLDIGAETPEEMAIAILAEMIQVRYGSGTGLSLKGTEGRIHAQRTDDPGDV